MKSQALFDAMAAAVKSKGPELVKMGGAAACLQYPSWLSIGSFGLVRRAWIGTDWHWCLMHVHEHMRIDVFSYWYYTATAATIVTYSDYRWLVIIGYSSGVPVCHQRRWSRGQVCA